jgi:hypothetical protein
VTPGTKVIITGTGFQNGLKVFVGGVAATLTSTPSATSAIVISPALPVGPADVTLINPDGQKAVAPGAFTATAPAPVIFPSPVLGAVSPNAANPGSVVLLLGSGFQAKSAVFIGGALAAPTDSLTSSMISVVVPAHPVGLADVRIINPDGQAASLPDAFFVLPGA